MNMTQKDMWRKLIVHDRYDYIGNLVTGLSFLLVSAACLLFIPVKVQVGAIALCSVSAYFGLWLYFNRAPEVRNSIATVMDRNMGFRRILYANAVLTAALIVAASAWANGGSVLVSLAFAGVAVVAYFYSFARMSKTGYADKGREYSSSYFNGARNITLFICLILISVGVFSFGALTSLGHYFARYSGATDQLMAQPLTAAEKDKIKSIQDRCRIDPWAYLCRTSSTQELTQIIKNERLAKKPESTSASVLNELVAFAVLVPLLAFVSLLSWKAYFVGAGNSKEFNDKLDVNLRMFIKNNLNIPPTEKNLEHTKAKIAESTELLEIVARVAIFAGIEPVVAIGVVKSQQPTPFMVKPLLSLFPFLSAPLLLVTLPYIVAANWTRKKEAAEIPASISTESRSIVK